MANLIWFIPLFPLLGFLINGLLGKRMPAVAAASVGSLAVLASFVLVLGMFFTDTVVTESLYTFFAAGDFSVDFTFKVDHLSIVMMLVITGVGFLIHVYSAGYMLHDEAVTRFFAYLNLFVFFMLLLVLGGNYVIMFIGWEGVGLCSYLLIGFWFKNVEYSKAAQKAFVMNRIGDLGFLLGMFLLVQQFGTLDYDLIFTKASGMQVGAVSLTVITMLLFVGATGKSAQIPLYTWLPDAMAGPTPVSALIHAATMVTAGIYMIIRSNVLYTLSPITLSVIAIIGGATAIIAATIGVAQNDIKKVLAYSTVSQLGYMFIALGVGAYTASYFHVFTHAFFKALLFLGAGSVIHALHHEQDMKNMGGLAKKLPITFVTMFVACIAIAGIPPFAGFFSKDEILAKAFAYSPILWAVGALAAGFTAFYMFRLLFATFFGTYRGADAHHDHAHDDHHQGSHEIHESPITMTLPLMILAVLSAIAGFLNVPEILGGSAKLSAYLDPVIGIKPEAEHALSHSTEFILMGISIAIAAAGIIIAMVMFVFGKKVPAETPAIWAKKYYVDEIYDFIISKPLLWLSTATHKWVDRAGIDGILVNGSAFITQWTGKMSAKTQNGYTGFYISLMVVGVIAILAFNMLLK